MLHIDGSKPIYIQIAEWVETEILKGNFQADEKVYSQYKLAEIFNINPATAAKGLTLLANEGVLYDKRGRGKFVAKDAKEYITNKRRDQTLHQLIQDIVKEADGLLIGEEELMEMVRKVYAKLKEDKR